MFGLNLRILVTLMLLVIQACGSKNQNPGATDAFSEYNIFPVDLKGKKEIVLTFDDGPTPHTPEILAILAEYDAKGVFFVNGYKARNHPEILQAISDQGHILGNHTDTHANLNQVSIPQAISEIRKTHRTISSAINPAQNGLYFRAPFGAWPAKAAQTLNRDYELSSYIGPIFWDIGGVTTFEKSTGKILAAADWNCSAKTDLNGCILGYLNETLIKQGGIVLMHDTNEQTPIILEGFLHRVLNLGFKVVELEAKLI